MTPDVQASEFTCRVCGGPSASHFTALEMMYGTREAFDYFTCAACGCVQIANIPDDLGRHYRDGYYSFVVAKNDRGARARKLARKVVFSGANLPPVRSALERHSADARLLLRYMSLLPDRNARILDVGAGNGRIVRSLRDLGYRNALGVDAFIPSDIVDGAGLVVRRCDLSAVDGEWNLISFNHSLEHMPDQIGTLRVARRLLAKGGQILVRVPVAEGEAWRTYGANWIQLDPPRHLFLHTQQSLRTLAEHSGLTVTDTCFDSTAYQFWGSELVNRDVALFDPGSPRPSKSTLRKLERRARALNINGQGDQVAAVMAPRLDSHPTEASA